MKKSLVLKLVVLAMLCYVAIMPNNTSASCELSECVTFDDGEPGCAYYSGGSYSRECYIESFEMPPGSNEWVNQCKIRSC